LGVVSAHTEGSHPERQIEGTRMDEQSLEHVLVPTHVRATETTGLVQMRARALNQFASHSEEAFPAVTRMRRRLA
jgi:hypothetical protein